MWHLVDSTRVATRQFFNEQWFRLLTSFQAILSVSSYVEKISGLFMDIGRSVPRCEALTSLYPKCPQLRSFFTEYFVVVVQLCHQLLKFTQKSSFQQFTFSLRDSELSTFKSELTRWSKLMDERVSILTAMTIETEAQKSSRFRSFSSKQVKQIARHQEQATKIRILEFCSRYDHITTWKQTRKIGDAVVFKKSSAYREWRDRSRSCTILCKGTLGSGKSVLLANIVDDLHIHAQSKNITTAYFFCRYDIPESLKARTILGSLARQLLSAVPHLGAVKGAYDDNASVGDSDAVLKILHHVFPPERKVYVVLDGLDECDNSEAQALALGIQTLQKQFDILLCVSCRLEPNKKTEAITQKFAAPQSNFILDDNSDIQAYIESELEYRLEHRHLVLGDPNLILDIRDALLDGSQGMFLWVALQIESLCTMKTDQAIRSALADLPKDLAETFNRILRRSKGQGQSYQTRILQLVTVARQPLTAGDLQEALSVVPGNTIWDPSQILNDMDSVLAYCGCLLMVDEEELTVRFVHHSVKKFVLSTAFDSSDKFTNACAHKTMTDIVITYLSYGIFGTQVSTTRVPRVMTHTVPTSIIRATTAPSKHTQSLALKILKSRTKHNFDITKTLAEARRPSNSAYEDEFRFYSYASSHWLKHLIALTQRSLVVDKLLSGVLIGNKVSTNLSDEDHQALLWWAVQIGHEGVVKMFLQAGTTGYSSTRDGSLALLFLWARDNGHSAIIELLMSKGFDIDGLSTTYSNALQAAAALGNEQVSKLLIDNHANVNPVNGEYDPLQAASYYGHEEIVRLLIEAGADVNACSGDLGQALYASAERGHEEVARILLDAGSDVNAVSRDYGDALQQAAYFGHMNIVKLLLERGADINAECGHYGNALQAAAHKGSMRMVEFLYARGADINRKSGTHGSALQAAALQGHLHVVEALIGWDADVNAQGGEDGNALRAASKKGHQQIVQLLVEHHASENVD
jgi:ankyrin repeat protein